MSSSGTDSVKSSMQVHSSRSTNVLTTPPPTTPSGRRLRSSARLRTTNTSSSSSNDISVPSSFVKSTTRMIHSSVINSSAAPTTSNIHDKVAAFVDATHTAMTTLIQDHGYSRERAKLSLLDQLISSAPHQSTLQSRGISDEMIFDHMRQKNIGMEHATIALTIEQTISSMLNDSALSCSSISEVLDSWTQCLQHVKPKPLTHLTMKTSSAFGSPLTTLKMSNVPPLAPRQQPESSPSIKAPSKQQSSNVPGTPACSIDATGNGKTMSSRTRSKTGAKKSSKAACSTPPLSTITIATTTSTATSQQRSRADSVTEAVSAKLTSSSTTTLDSECNQHLSNASRGKPPLVPNTSGSTSATGGASASIIGRPSSSTGSLNSSSKRCSMDSTRMEHQPESSSLLHGTGRPASPSTLPPSAKRQRRSSSMNSDN